MDGTEEWGGGDAVEKVGEDGERKRGKGGKGEQTSSERTPTLNCFAD